MGTIHLCILNRLEISRNLPRLIGCEAQSPRSHMAIIDLSNDLFIALHADQSG